MHLFYHKDWKINHEASNLASAAFYLGCDEKDLAVIKTWTEEEYILKDIPIQFHSVLSQMAYEKGHHAGESECMSILRELVYDLKPAIDKFREDLIKELRGKA